MKPRVRKCTCQDPTDIIVTQNLKNGHDVYFLASTSFRPPNQALENRSDFLKPAYLTMNFIPMRKDPTVLPDFLTA